MGIPKFYRWLSERYPCLSEVLKEYQIPEFDNLYLDMNGIIHTCSHPDDSSVYIQVSEDKIFKDICHYIEVLFRMIKPKKVFYMAVDGVAPRAKVNQQRSRRFRSAKEAEVILRKEARKGGDLPTGTRFDSNCITPGTEFMTRLNSVLTEFVASKVKSDPMWQRPLVIFSGHEAPGEGEHKIMDFIRREKSRSGFDPNTRHCLYGLDADLIMLSLVSHEPHFALLREEVKFSKKEMKKRTVLPEDTTFHLLHISLLRDYLNLEFASLKDVLPFDYDMERIIDDWVLLGFLVGNDFVPHLPNLHIHRDCLPLLWKIYKNCLPTLGGYINEGGKLNLPRFEQYLSMLHQFEFDKFEEDYADRKWLGNKKKGGKQRRKKNELQQLENNNHNNIPDGSFMSIATVEEDICDDDEDDIDVDTSDDEDIHDYHNELIDIKFSLSSEVVGIPSATEFLEKGEDQIVEDESEIFEEIDEPSFVRIQCDEHMSEEFKKFKAEYYQEKFGYDVVDEEILQSMANKYVEAIQWILHYYYNGIQSWSWFYPYHYAPFVTDVRNFSKLKLTFNMGLPFLPFQQLMAVLPKASKELLPPALQKLMEVGSSVENYYPDDFKTDLNGKLQEWEAVVLIPFIDEKILLQAMEPQTKKMSAEEKSRNKHGPHNLYCVSDSRDLSSYIPPSSQVLNDGKVMRWDLSQDYFVLKVKDLYKGLCQGVNLKSLFYGFPSLRHVPHEGSLQNIGVRVFQRGSTNPSMVLTLKSPEEVSIEDVSKSLIGQVAFVNWPHLVEALVVYVSTDELKIAPKENVHRQESNLSLISKDLEINDEAFWHKDVELLKDRYQSRFGINIGETKLIVGAKRLVGKKFVVKGSGEVVLEKTWSTIVEQFLYQTSVEYGEGRNFGKDEHYMLTDYFQKGSNVFLLANPYYGCEGTVIEVLTSEQSRVLAQFGVPVEPNLDWLKSQAEEFDNSFLPAYMISQRLSMSAHLLSRITGTVFLVNDSKKINIGLNLKFNKLNKEVPGYTKKVGNDWLYSTKVIDLMMEYYDRFPELFEGITTKTKNDVFSASAIFGENRAERCSELESFLNNLPTKNVEPRPQGSMILDADVVKQIEKEVTRQKERGSISKMKIKPHLLYVPKIVHAPCVPDEQTNYQLFDRVVNVRPGFTVPLGLRGTLIGIEPGEKGQDFMYHVLFDKEFNGGMSLGCSSNKCYRVPAIALINISYGARAKSGKKNKNINHGNQSQMNGFIKENSIKENSIVPLLSCPIDPRVLPGGVHVKPRKKEAIKTEQRQEHMDTDRSEYAVLWNELKGSNVKPSESKDREPLPPFMNPFPYNMMPVAPTMNPFPHNMMPVATTMNPFPHNMMPVATTMNPFPHNVMPVPPTMNPFFPKVMPVPPTINPFAPKVMPVPPTINPFAPNVTPVPPNLKPPQSWIDKLSMNHNHGFGGAQNANQIGRKISFEELVNGSNLSMQHLSMNGHVQPSTIPMNNSSMKQQHHHQLHHHQQQQYHQQQQLYHQQLQQPTLTHQHFQPHGHHHQQLYQQQQQLELQPSQQHPFNFNHHQQQTQHHHHHQQQLVQHQNNVANNGPKRNNLITFCRANNLAYPKYEIQTVDGGNRGRVHIRGLGWFVGPMRSDESEAIEEACGLALNRLIQQQQFNGVQTNVGNSNLPSNVSMVNAPLQNQPKQESGSPGVLNPKAHVFIPTQVMLRQKSTKVTAACGLECKPLQDQPVSSDLSKHEESSEVKDIANVCEKKVVSKKIFKTRIAASFTALA